uniref:Uncharacterized protein n=1 Tax=Arundo donax TaxID=35708 RepID=A0A0A9DEA1_ARUDO
MPFICRLTCRCSFLGPERFVRFRNPYEKIGFSESLQHMFYLLFMVFHLKERSSLQNFMFRRGCFTIEFNTLHIILNILTAIFSTCSIIMTICTDRTRFLCGVLQRSSILRHQRSNSEGGYNLYILLRS